MINILAGVKHMCNFFNELNSDYHWACLISLINRDYQLSMKTCILTINISQRYRKCVANQNVFSLPKYRLIKTDCNYFYSGKLLKD